MTADVIWLRGEGGAVFRMTVPLSPHIQQRWEAGHMTRVNQDGTPWVEDAAAPQPRARRKPAAKSDDASTG